MMYFNFQVFETRKHESVTWKSY